MKKLLIALLVLVALVGILVVYLGSNLDDIVARSIARIGERALGVEVSVESVELRFREASGSIRGLRIANPPGYGPEPALSLDELTLSLDSEAGGVELLRAGAPEIRVESIEGTSNVDVLLSALARSPAEPEAGEPETIDELAEPVSMRFERIEIEAARAVLISDQRDQPIDLQVSALTFENLDGTGEEIARQILRQLLSDVKAAAARALRDSATRAIEAKKEEVRESVAESIEAKKEEKKEELREKARERRDRRRRDGG